MTHADAVREAKERVVESALEWSGALAPNGSRRVLLERCMRLRALVAQTCDQCGGAGVVGRWNSHPTMADKCPSACDNGKRAAALSPSSDGSKEAAND